MYTLLIPRDQSLKETKTGRNSPFWGKYWEKRLAENPEHYQKEYSRRVSRLKGSVHSITETFQDPNKKYYVEAKFDELVDSKTKEPTEIWKESGVQIVETKEDGSVTLSGSSGAYKRLEEILGNATFETASVEKFSKAQSLSREVFSVTSLLDKNNSIDKRISKDIQQYISSGNSAKISCVLMVYFDRAFQEYEALYRVMTDSTNISTITKVDVSLFMNNMFFIAELDATEIRRILENGNCNFISYIKPSTVFTAQRSTPNTDPSQLQIGAPLTTETVVIIDSGISNPVIDTYVSQRENFLVTGDIPDTGHGTSVASRLLFGDNIFSATQSGTQINPVGKLIDIKVIHRDNRGDLFVPNDRLMKAIEQSVRRYNTKTTIYNLSVSASTGVDNVDIDEVTEMIDTLSNKHDILFVCAVGNQNSNFPIGYNKIFSTAGIDTHIASPSDAINALSVGSIAGIADAGSICDTPNLPSPFTRKGGIRNEMKKPEVVAPGGNIQLDTTGVYNPAHLGVSARTYGVEVIDSAGFSRDVGTSFSTPLISRECLKLLDYLKNSDLATHLPGFAFNKANLTKALMIHSTERVVHPTLANKGLKHAYGWGKTDVEAVLKDDDNQITVVYADKISFKEKKQKVLIKLPDFLLNKPVEIILTLVYNPPVNKNFKEYKMIDLQPSIGFIHPGKVEEGEETGKNVTRGNNPSHSWENYRTTHFPTIHFKKERRRLTGLDFQILVSMLISTRLLDENVGHEDEISQNYALVLTVRDKSESGQLREEILNSNQFFELVENTVEVES